MEAFLILFADLLNAIIGMVAGAVWIVITLVVLVIECIVDFLLPSMPAPKDVRYNPSPPALPKTPRQKFKLPSWSKYVLWGMSGLALTLVVLFIIAETLYFEQTVRWIANRQAPKTSVQVSFDSVEGSFFKRKFAFQNLHIVRAPTDGTMGFDLRSHRVEGAFEGGFLSIPKSMNTLSLHGTKGEIILPERSTSVSQEPGSISLEIILQGRPGFTVKKLTVTDVGIQLFTAEQSKLTNVIIQEWISAPLRSRNMAFDLLFRSNLDATIGDALVIIRTSGEQQARETHWQITHVPIPPMTNLLGPPWDIIQDGNVHLEIIDKWSLADNDLFVDSQWNLSFKNLILEPDGSGNMISRFRQSAMAGLLRRHIEKYGDLEIQFSLRIEDGSLSTSMNGLLRDLVELAVKASLLEIRSN